MNKKMFLAMVMAVGTMAPAYAPEAKQVGIMGDVVTWDYPVARRTRA